jgi:lysophospholipase L1-like esterase
MVVLVLMVGIGCQRPIQVSHKEIVTLDSAANRVAVIGDSYTTGTDLGGAGGRGWTTLAWNRLAKQQTPITADVGAEGGAGYATRGNRGSLFEDLTKRILKPDDSLVVFFGSRNDQAADPARVSVLAYGTFQLARRIAPSAILLVIGPPWPTRNPPPNVLAIRDALRYQAGVARAFFVDPIAEGWFVGRPDLIASDGIHPTDKGHQYLASMIAPLIAERLPVRV